MSLGEAAAAIGVSVDTLRRWADTGKLHTSRDERNRWRVPAAEIERPGIAEAMRQASQPYTANWMLSRATAGVRGGTLIVNLPGSPCAIVQVSEALSPALAHALELIAEDRPRRDAH